MYPACNHQFPGPLAPSEMDPESDRTLLHLGCESEDSLEESRGRKSTIEVSEIYECEGSSF